MIDWRRGEQRRREEVGSKCSWVTKLVRDLTSCEKIDSTTVPFLMTPTAPAPALSTLNQDLFKTPSRPCCKSLPPAIQTSYKTQYSTIERVYVITSIYKVLFLDHLLNICKSEDSWSIAVYLRFRRSITSVVDLRCPRKRLQMMIKNYWI